MVWKNGIICFFFHLASCTGKDEYENIAGELLNSILQNLSSKMSIFYGSGLSGIGTGIEYLLQEGFISGDSNEILEDIDNAIFSELTNYDNCDSGLENGICGIGKYFLYRIKNRQVKKDNLITLKNKQNIIYLLDLLDHQKQLPSSYQDEIFSFLLSIWEVNIYNVKVEKLLRYYTQQKLFNFDLLHKRLTIQQQKKQNDLLISLQNKNPHIIKHSKAGLKNGYAGIGLAILATLNTSKSWINLIC